VSCFYFHSILRGGGTFVGDDLKIVCNEENYKNIFNVWVFKVYILRISTIFGSQLMCLKYTEIQNVFI
jgi:hypothetical protein